MAIRILPFPLPKGRPMDRKKLEAKLILANLTDKQIAELKDKSHFRKKALAAICFLSLPRDREFPSGRVEQTCDRNPNYAHATLPPDFVRPTITPDDLPADTRHSLETGFPFRNFSPFAKSLLRYFAPRGLVDYDSADGCMWRPKPPGDIDLFYENTRYRLRPEPPTCPTCGKPKSCDCVEKKWREPVIPGDLLKDVWFTDGSFSVVHTGAKKKLHGYSWDTDFHWEDNEGTSWRYARIEEDS